MFYKRIIRLRGEVTLLVAICQNVFRNEFHIAISSSVSNIDEQRIVGEWWNW